MLSAKQEWPIAALKQLTQRRATAFAFRTFVQCVAFLLVE